VPYLGVPKIELNLPLSSAETVVKEPPDTVPCELLLGAKSPYAALFRLSIVEVVVIVPAGANANADDVDQTSTTNRCEPMLAVGPFHSGLNVYDGVVLVPTLFTDAKACGAVAIGLATVGRASCVLVVVAVAVTELFRFAKNQQSWFVVESKIRT